MDRIAGREIKKFLPRLNRIGRSRTRRTSDGLADQGIERQPGWTKTNRKERTKLKEYSVMFQRFLKLLSNGKLIWILLPHV